MVDTVLRDVAVGGFLWIKSFDEVARRADHPAMGHQYARAHNAAQHKSNTRCSLCIAFPARRREVPFVGAALCDQIRLTVGKVFKRPALPIAECHLDQRVIDAIGKGIKTHGFSHQFHRLARAPQRTGQKSPLRPIALQPGQKSAIGGGLPLAQIIERYVNPTLKTPLAIPVGFAMANDEKRDLRLHAVFARMFGRHLTDRRALFWSALGDVGCVDRLHADHMVAGIHMVGLTGHRTRQIGQKIQCRVADFLDGHRLAQR